MLIGFSAMSQEVLVKDQTTHEPLDLVAIYSQNPVVSALTNEKGRADLSPFKGSTRIEFSRLGYLTYRCTYLELSRVNFRIYMIADEISLGEVVVSATRWQQNTTDLPQRISTIKPASIMLENPQTAADLLASSGEVYVQKSQLGGGSPMIRGFSTNRLLITVDGVRMNNAIFRSGNLQNVISLDPLAIESTEIFFGPGSVIYGSDAIGGVMSFHTLKPRFSDGDIPRIKGSAFTRWSSANMEKTGHLDLNFGFRKVAVATSATFTDYGDQKMGSHGPEEYLRPTYGTTIDGRDTMLINPDPRVQKPTGYSQFNLTQKLLYKHSDRLTIDYGFHYSTTSDFSRYDRLIRYRGERQRSAEWYYGPQTWMMNAFNLSHTGRRSAYDNLRLTLAHQFFEESRHDRDWNDKILRHRTEQVKAFSINLDLEKGMSEKTHLFYGVEAILNDVHSTGEDANLDTRQLFPGPARYPNPAVWDSYAVYGSIRHKPSEKLTLQAGARYNQVVLSAVFDTVFYQFPFERADIGNGAVTGSAGAAWSPNSRWQLNINLSTGFRAPNIDDVGKVFDSEPGAVIVPNPALKPEYAYNGEVSAVRIFSDKVKLDMTVYYTWLDDALVRRDFTLNGQDSLLYLGEMSRVQAVQNAASAWVYGLQAGLEVKFPVGFGLSSRFNYQRGEEELDDGSTAPLRHAAPWFGVTRFTYKRDRVRTELYAVYNGRVTYENLAPEERGKTYMYAIDEDGNPWSPGWYTLNFKLLWQTTPYLIISGGIENITDRRYRPYSSGIAAPGRNFIVSLKATF